jgi:hypothetical protein
MSTALILSAPKLAGHRLSLSAKMWLAFRGTESNDGAYRKNACHLAPLPSRGLVPG